MSTVWIGLGIVGGVATKVDKHVEDIASRAVAKAEGLHMILLGLCSIILLEVPSAFPAYHHFVQGKLLIWIKIILKSLHQ